MNASAEFNSGEPLAFLLTWTTYGTWLPGDHRGWHQQGNSGPHAPNRFIAGLAKSRLQEVPFSMTREMRTLVNRTIAQHCELRQWTLHGANARSNHVHVVVAAPDRRPESVEGQLKAWCTRRLKEIVCDRKRFWTEGGSRRYLNHDGELQQAIVYVLEAQDRKGQDV